MVVEAARRLTLVLESMGRLGEAMAQADGKPVFVFGGIPGEEVVAEVVRDRRHYIAAEVVEVIKASPHRVAVPCPYFGRCTGCQWQHIEYGHQLELKHHAVEDALSRVGGLSGVTVLPTLGSPKQHEYRNHARFTVRRNGGRLGYVHRERRRFVDIDRCMLMVPQINDVLTKLQGRCAETTQLSVRYGVHSGSWLIQPSLKNSDIGLESGQKHYEEAVNGARFRVAASSFFQVNLFQMENLVKLLRDSLHLSGREVLVDAYAGVGTFAALLAPYAAKVIAVEESASAVKDARDNLAGHTNVEVRQGKTEAVLAEMSDEVDAVVLDPPRAGCQGQAIEALTRLAPARIAYVSCDAETLARDLKLLVAGPYQIAAVQPVDMFPQTHHIETLTTLVLKTGHPIILASASPRRRQILKDAGIAFRAQASDVEETSAHQQPEAYVVALAPAKARAVAASLHRGTVLAADTIVVDGQAILGKPRDHAHALEMLRQLRGREHKVMTGVAVVDASSGQSASGIETTVVTMRPYTEEEASTYVASGDAMDKAGSYAIQDAVFRPAASVEGCYLNVVGLPLCLAEKLLRQMGVALDTLPSPIECHHSHKGS